MFCACALLLFLGCHTGTAWQQAELELCEWLVEESGDCGGEEACVPVVCQLGCGGGEPPVMVLPSVLELAHDECQSTKWTTRAWSETDCEDEDAVAVNCSIGYYH